MRELPSPLYGVTVDDVSNLTEILDSFKHFQRKPTTRIVFDVGTKPSDYSQAISTLQPSSYLMGELLDSSEEKEISASAEHARVANFLKAFGNSVDLWEVGNEVNGNWLGSYTDVEAKLVDAYDQVSAAGKRTALTLYANNFGPDNCGDGLSELTPAQFTQRYVPANVARGLNYVFLSYYEAQCGGVRPTAGQVASYMQQLHALYPHALLGFGEIGLPDPVTSSTLSEAESIVDYYYGLSARIDLPYYVGGYFYWNYVEDALPWSSKPIWGHLNEGFGKY
jgi:hypothetical protein